MLRLKLLYQFWTDFIFSIQRFTLAFDIRCQLNFLFLLPLFFLPSRNKPHNNLSTNHHTRIKNTALYHVKVFSKRCRRSHPPFPHLLYLVDFISLCIAFRLNYVDNLVKVRLIDLIKVLLPSHI